MADRDHRVPETLREEYHGEPLDERSVARSPFELFGAWFDAAVAAEIPLANGMILATVDAGGQPSTRTVLLKEWDEHGLVFFSNYQSRKGQELEANPRASLLFWWSPLARQVRVEGRASRVSKRESDEYFAVRPRPSNLSAMASPQSQVVPGRTWLEERVGTLQDQWHDRELERPPHWGGYRVVPHRFEFWQGRSDRMHDRVVYRRLDSGVWDIHRLAP